tara:strand:+ start:157 stop:537 length:381 start_codon:yes stop_codon:yes gene_type:complete
MQNYYDKWKNYLKEGKEEELFKVEMIMSFPLTRDIELETLYDILRAVPDVTRVNAEKSQKRATNVYIELEIKIIRRALGGRSPASYVKEVLVPNIYNYAKGDYRPNIMPHSVKVMSISQGKQGLTE